MKVCVRNRMLSGHTNVSQNIEKQFFRENGLLLNSAAAVVVAAPFLLVLLLLLLLIVAGQKKFGKKLFFKTDPIFPLVGKFVSKILQYACLERLASYCEAYFLD